jgi:hypothetical protein
VRLPGLLSFHVCASFKDVEHPCEKCGNPVEDGRPFCPHCRAPQVRVEIAAQSPPSNFDIQAEAEADPPPDSPDRLPAYGPSERSIFRTALQAGLLGVAANLIPFGVGMVLTGILAAWLHQRAVGRKLTTRTAARLGAEAGAIAFAVSALLTVVTIVLLHAQQQFRDLMMKAVEQRAGGAPDPEMQAALQWLHTPDGFALALAFSMVILLFLSVLFSAVGSMATAALSQDQNHPS